MLVLVVVKGAVFVVLQYMSGEAVYIPQTVVHAVVLVLSIILVLLYGTRNLLQEIVKVVLFLTIL